MARITAEDVLETIRELMGYQENGTDVNVNLYQDSDTKEFRAEIDGHILKHPLWEGLLHELVEYKVQLAADRMQEALEANGL